MGPEFVTLGDGASCIARVVTVNLCEQAAGAGNEIGA
jgi:hypothetical protein